MNDINNLMEFRSNHWDLWLEFVKDIDGYCKHGNCEEWGKCEECEAEK